MAATFACIADCDDLDALAQAGVVGENLGRRSTPFGPSGPVVFLDGPAPLYVLLRSRLAPQPADCRANVYALRDLGCRMVLGVGAGRAITHNLSIGQLLLLSDVVDRTTHRARSFFPRHPLGRLRQFPVFCEELCRLTGDVLGDLGLTVSIGATAAICEGPRHETPAESRLYAHLGVEAITHTFAPELFLARELEMGYAALCVIDGFAETGSRYRPFEADGLFAGMPAKSDPERLEAVRGSYGEIVRRVSARLDALSPLDWGCLSSQAGNIQRYDLSPDWHDWFNLPGA